MRAFVLLIVSLASFNVCAQGEDDYCFDPYPNNFAYGNSMYWHEEISHWSQMMGGMQQDMAGIQESLIHLHDEQEPTGAREQLKKLNRFYSDLRAEAFFCLNQSIHSEGYAAGNGFYSPPPFKHKKPISPFPAQ